jgi:alpha-amylase
MLLTSFKVFSGDNPVILQGFYWYIGDPGSKNQTEESNLWNYIAKSGAKRFKEDGITHVWLPPMFKAFSPHQEYNNGYAVYDLYDLGEFHQMGRKRTKYGTKAELLKATATLRKEGVKVIADIVMNQRLGASKKESIPYEIAFKVKHMETPQTLVNGKVDAYLHFDFKNPGDKDPRGTRHSKFVWKKEHFDGMENYDSYYLFKGKTLDKVNRFNDIPFLPQESKHHDLYNLVRSDIILGADIDYEHPEVQTEMIRWTKWLVNEVGVDGFRVDAIRHIHIPFIKRWANEITTFMKGRKTSNGKMLMFGENWDGWAERLNGFLTGKTDGKSSFFDWQKSNKDYSGIENSMSLFDVPLHYDFTKVAKVNNDYPATRMTDLPKRGLVAINPSRAITFVDNHDTVPTQELASYIPYHTKLQAYTFILLNEHGIPTVFYRDLYKGNFVSPYKNNHQKELNKGISELINIRKKYAYGPGKYYSDPFMQSILGYHREGDKQHQGSGLIYLIREYDSTENGLVIDSKSVKSNKWKLIAGGGYQKGSTFYLNKKSHYAVWIKATKI